MTARAFRDDRAMVKSTAGVAHVRPKPQLALVPRRRRTARLVAAGCVLVFGLMMGAAAFQTQVARRQLQLDTMDRKIRGAHEQYDVLRRERAELRSPGRLALEAGKLGMVPALQTEFISLDPKVIAEVQRTGVKSDEVKAITIDEEFATYAKVKAQAGGVP
jgi:hypothetical protein